MDAVTFIAQSLSQAHERLTKSLEGLTSQQVSWRPAEGANAVIEILWHVVRAEDRIVKAALGAKTELWESQNWRQRISLAGESGLDDGYRFLELGLNAPELKDLVAYFDAVNENTLTIVRGMSPADLDEVPDSSTPAQTVAARLRHLITHNNNHHGQIDYIRGLMQPEWDLPPGTGMEQK